MLPEFSHIIPAKFLYPQCCVMNNGHYSAYSCPYAKIHGLSLNSISTIINEKEAICGRKPYESVILYLIGYINVYSMPITAPVMPNAEISIRMPSPRSTHVKAYRTDVGSKSGNTLSILISMPKNRNNPPLSKRNSLCCFSLFISTLTFCSGTGSSTSHTPHL